MNAKEYNELVKKGKRIASEECVLKNTLSNAKGMHFENDIKKACIGYQTKGKAVINKVNEPYRVMRKLRDGSFYGRFTGRAEPDFKGVLAGGRAVAFEAKSTSKSRIQKSVITEVQEEWLEEQFNMGAVTFVCVLIKDKAFSVPWEVWKNMKTIYGKKFLMAEDIKEFGIDYDLDGVKFLDYIDGGDHLKIKEETK